MDPLWDELALYTTYLIGFVIAFRAGPRVDTLLRENIAPAPEGTPPNPKGGEFLGKLERITFFAALATCHPELIAGWLLFKVASKWEFWQNIVKVGTGDDGHMTLHTRRAWGSNVYQRFLSGTLLNILFAGLGYLVAQGLYRAYEVLIS